MCGPCLLPASVSLTLVQAKPKDRYDAIHRAAPPPNRALKAVLVEGHVERVFDAKGGESVPNKASVREARAAFLERLARNPPTLESTSH
jgi:uncharacterized protein (DUF2342 family)